MARTYLNTTAEQDSSVGWEGWAGTNEAEGFSGVILIVDEGQCGCGCREKNRTANATFLPGHDARYKGILQRAHQRGDEVHVIQGGTATSASAEVWASNRGWERYINAADNRKTKVAKAAEVAAARNGGRSTKKANLGRLDGLKAAGQVLKRVGLFKLAARHVTSDNFERIVETEMMPATAKIGRWEREGWLMGPSDPKPGQTIDRWQFTYTDKKGQQIIESIVESQIVWAL